MNQAAAPDDHEEVGALELLVLLARHKHFVISFPFAVAVVTALIVLALPNYFTGTARILPPQQTGSPITAILMGDTSGLSSGSSVGQALGLKSPSDLYVGMLQSQTISDALVARFGLKDLYGEDTLVETRDRLAELSRIVASGDGIITIEVQDKVPTRAADLANAYVEELDRLTQTVAVTSAGRQRVFLEKQLRQAKDQLAEAEVALRVTQEQTGIISVTDQGKAMIESVANLRALVAAKQVQLIAMRTSTTEVNPEYIRAQQELVGLRQELAKLEKASPSDVSSVIPSAGRIPKAGLEFVRKFRDVQYYQTLFELVAKQFEIAKAQEAAEAGQLQILDKARAPDKKSRPSRALIVIVTAVLAFFLGVVAAFASEARHRALRDPSQAALLQELYESLPETVRRVFKRPQGT